MAAIVGCAGLKPAMAAVEAGGTVALANKEALVSAGAADDRGGAAQRRTLLPVDSEHNAIFQCFDRARPESVRRIILTASGGPFRCFCSARTWPSASSAPVAVGNLRTVTVAITPLLDAAPAR